MAVAAMILGTPILEAWVISTSGQAEASAEAPSGNCLRRKPQPD